MFQRVLTQILRDKDNSGYANWRVVFSQRLVLHKHYPLTTGLRAIQYISWIKRRRMVYVNQDGQRKLMCGWSIHRVHNVQDGCKVVRCQFLLCLRNVVYNFTIIESNVCICEQKCDCIRITLKHHAKWIVKTRERHNCTCFFRVCNF